jgi:hypothetical protein
MGIPLSTRLNDTLEKDDDGLYGVSESVLASILAAAAAAPLTAAQSGSAIATYPTPADIPGLTDLSVSSTGIYLLELTGRAIRNPSHTTARCVVAPAVLSGAMTWLGDFWGYDFGASTPRVGSTASTGSSTGITLPAAVVPVILHLWVRIAVSALSAGACHFKMQLHGATGSTDGDQIQLEDAVAKVTKIA